MIFPDTSVQLNFLGHEAIIRTGCFLLLFTTIAVAEIVVPRRALIVKKPLRWFANISIHLANDVLPRLLFPILPVGMALLWARKGWGLLNIIPLPEAASLLRGGPRGDDHWSYWLSGCPVRPILEDDPESI